MPTLAEIISARIAHKDRLRSVPPAIVEDILRLAFREMATWMSPDGFNVEFADGSMFAACEGPGVRGNGCSNFGAPESMRIVRDEDGDEVIVCHACYADLNGDALPFGGEDEAA